MVERVSLFQKYSFVQNTFFHVNEISGQKLGTIRKKTTFLHKIVIYLGSMFNFGKKIKFIWFFYFENEKLALLLFFKSFSKINENKFKFIFD